MLTLKCDKCGDRMKIMGKKIIGRTKQEQVLEDIVFTCMGCLNQTEIKKYRKEMIKDELSEL